MFSGHSLSQSGMFTRLAVFNTLAQAAGSDIIANYSDHVGEPVLLSNHHVRFERAMMRSEYMSMKGLQ